MRQVPRLPHPYCHYADAAGKGLRLRVSSRGLKSLAQRPSIKGRGHRDTPLGRYPAVSLAKGRRIAAENHEIAREGQDPTEVRRAQVVTFRERAEAKLRLDAPSESATITRKARRLLENHAYDRLGLKLFSSTASPRATGRTILRAAPSLGRTFPSRPRTRTRSATSIWTPCP